MSDNLYTSGSEYILPTGEEYVGDYHTHPSMGAMVGAVHTDFPHDRLTLMTNLRSTDDQGGTDQDGSIGPAQWHTNNGVTLAFSTKSNVWRSRYSFVPTCYATLDNYMLSCMKPNNPDSQGGSGHKYTNTSFVWDHNNIEDFNEFYEFGNLSFLEVVSNHNPSAVKIFKALSIEGDGDWRANAYTNVSRGGDPEQQTNDFSFDEKESSFYSDIPASITDNEEDRNRELMFIGFVKVEDFFATEDNVESIDGFSQKWTLPLVSIPKVSLPTSDSTALWFGRKLTLQSELDELAEDPNYMIPDSPMSFLSIIEVFPLAVPHGEPINYDGHNEARMNPMGYNSETNSIEIESRVADSIALEGGFDSGIGLEYFVYHFLNVGIPGLSADIVPVPVNYIPIYVSQPISKTGEMLRGHYMGANISGSGEIFAINVDFENTKLDGSLG